MAPTIFFRIFKTIYKGDFVYIPFVIEDTLQKAA